MKLPKKLYLLMVIGCLLLLLIYFSPLEVLEFLSIEIVGEPPINGLSWYEGVEALGGVLSMRVLASLGVIIIIFLIPSIMSWSNRLIAKKDERTKEIYFFLVVTVAFFLTNILIGYAWWDPNHSLGMGPLFFPSIISLITLGLIPEIAKKIFNFTRDDFADSKANIVKISVIMIFIAFGYGLISLIWHCCSFYEPKMFFFFFIIKLIQLWAMTSFFFKYGLPLFLSKTSKWVAYLVISVLFGFCYPWHTVGFALTFTLFGVLLCYLTSKTNSYLSGLILLYFAYIFHAGLAWQGAFLTICVIYPLTAGILAIVLLLQCWKTNTFILNIDMVSDT